MEQQPEQTTPTASPRPKPPRSFLRCRARTRDGRQCRMSALEPASGFCYRHIPHSEPDLLDDSTDLCAELFRADDGALNDVTSVSTLLTNVVILLGQGRISTRRAAVITYALSLLLRSLIATERQDSERAAAGQLPIFDPPTFQINREFGHTDKRAQLGETDPTNGNA